MAEHLAVSLIVPCHYILFNSVFLLLFLGADYDPHCGESALSVSGYLELCIYLMAINGGGICYNYSIPCKDNYSSVVISSTSYPVLA